MRLRSYLLQATLGIICVFVLGGCSSTSETGVGTAATQSELDLVSLEQYKPGIPVVEAVDLATGALQDALSNENLKVVREYAFSDGTVYNYTSVGNRVVFGDMITGTVDEFLKYLGMLDAQKTSGEPTLSPQGSFYKFVNTWPNGEIVFEIPSLDVYNATQKTQIQNAMQEITNRTNVGFRGTYNTSSGDRIRFTNPSSGCSADFGRKGGRQGVNLANACFGNSSTYLGTIFHELGHSAGLMHEHQRDDRGSKIIPSQYLTPLGESQIAETIPAGTRTSYEYLSNMHYVRKTGDRAFTTRPDLPLYATPNYSGGVRSNWITSGDIATYNLHYR